MNHYQSFKTLIVGVHKRHALRYSVIFSILMALVILPTGCGTAKTTATTDEKYTPVEVETAQQKTLVNTATLSGKVSSDTDVSVLPKVPGKVAEIAVKVGDSVKKGDVLFKLDTSDIQKQVDNAGAVLQLAQAGFQKSKEQWELAQTNLERTKAVVDDKLKLANENLENTRALYNAGGVSRVTLEQTESQYKELESTLNGQIEQLTQQAADSTLQLAQAQLNQAQVGYNQALDALNNAAVTAPVDGVIAQLNVSLGNMASNAQPAAVLTDTSKLYVALSVTENIVNRLSRDKVVKVNVPTVSNTAIEGKIGDISPASDPKTQLYPVKVGVVNPDGQIKPGMFAKAEIPIEEKSGVLAVKSEAVVLKNGKNLVYVVEGDKAVAKEVTTGLDTGTDLEILSGLKPGDQVITKGQTYVDEGGKVKVVGGKTL